MIDNSWVKSDGSSTAKSSVIRSKVIFTLIILLAGGVLTACLNGVGANSTQYQSEGIVIDFGNYETVWTNADYNTVSEPLALLDKACTEHSYTHTVDSSGKVTEIKGITDTATAQWGLWYVPKGEMDFVKAETYSINAKDYTVTAWAYCTSDSKPAVAVDAAGTSVYGYSQATRIVTLSPVATEVIGALDAEGSVVGTDIYSNYPKSIADGKSAKMIKEVGTYTDPSYESIMRVSPDIVICDGSQYNHIQMAKTLKNSDVNSLLLYDGESVQTIINNIFIAGVAIGYELRAQVVIQLLKDATDTIEGVIASAPQHTAMISLSPSTSPYVAANNTYASDILGAAHGINIYLGMAGWAHINSEFIGPSDKYGDQYNPDVAIVIASDPMYVATQESYDQMLSKLSSNWTSTKAFHNGQIYLLCESLGEMAQRSGPRYAQLEEIIARIMCPDAFTDGVSLPKYIGDDYQNYLKYTDDLGFGE